MNPTMRDWLTRAGGLAPRLRTLRERADLSSKALAERLGWPAEKVSRFENGRRLPNASDIEAWAAACGATSDADELLDLLTEAQAVRLDFKHQYRRGQAAMQAGFAQLIKESSLIRYFEVAVIPGILQVPGYSRRVLREIRDLNGAGVDDLEDAVRARREAQGFLDDDTAKRFEFILTEPVLRWRICSTDIMHAQLDRLQTILYLPKVRFGVIPFGRQLDTIPQTAFAVFDDIAYVETPKSEDPYTGPDAEFWANLMDRLWSEAVEGDDARRLIIRAADELRA